MGTSVSEARDILAELIGRVQYGHERITLERRGKPVAVLMPVEDAELLDELEDRILGEIAAERLAEYERTGDAIPLRELMAELDAEDAKEETG